MDIFNMDEYKINQRYLALCGIWPFEMSSTNSRVRKRMVEVSLVIATTLQALKIYTSPYSIEMLVEILTHFLPTLCVVTNYITFCFNLEKIKNILAHVREDWNSVQSKTEQEIIRSFAEKGRIFTLILALAYNTTIFSTMFLATVPLIMDWILPLNETRIRKLPVQLECIVDPNVYFLEILLLTYVVMTVQGFAGISTWAALVMIIQHICGMFELTGYVIENALGENTNEIHAKKVRSRLIRGIKLHKRTIKLLDLLNVVIEYANLIEMSFVVLLFGTDFLRILRVEMGLDNFIMSAMSVVYFFGHVSFLFLACHAGQNVLDYSSDIFEKVCALPWYNASREMRDLIIVLTMRTMKSSYLSMGGVFVATYEFFSGIMRLSMSYATGFYSLQ